MDSLDLFLDKLTTLLAESELSYLEMIGALELVKLDVLNSIESEDNNDEA